MSVSYSSQDTKDEKGKTSMIRALKKEKEKKKRFVERQVKARRGGFFIFFCRG